jgi:hypothetical protein
MELWAAVAAAAAELFGGVADDMVVGAADQKSQQCCHMHLDGLNTHGLQHMHTYTHSIV